MSIQETVTSALTRSSGSEDEFFKPVAVLLRETSPTVEKVTNEGAAAPAAVAAAAAAAAAATSSFTGTATDGFDSVRRARLPACCVLAPGEGDVDDGEGEVRPLRFRF